MTTVKDQIEDDEEVMEGAKEATLNKKRRETKYGSDLIEDEE